MVETLQSPTGLKNYIKKTHPKWTFYLKEWAALLASLRTNTKETKVQHYELSFKQIQKKLKYSSSKAPKYVGSYFEYLT